MAEERDDRIAKQAGATQKWEDAQRTAFTYWINTMLARKNHKIEDLQTGFQDGVKLIILAEVLVGKSIGQRYVEKPKLKAHKINNAFIALKFLQDVGGMKNLTISAENLVSGEFLTLILGFCWQLLKTFQEPPDFGDGEDGEGGGSGAGGADGKGGKSGNSYESRLLNWVKKTLGDKYPDVDLSEGFKSDGFRNGKALLGLISEFNPEYVDYAEYVDGEPHVNCRQALALAAEKMNIPAIIDGDELADGYVGDKQLVLYLSLLYNAFTDKEKGQSAESLAQKLKEREAYLRTLREENLKLKDSVNLLSVQFDELQLNYTEIQEDHSSLRLASKDTEEKLTTLKEEWEQAKESWGEETTKLKSKLAAMMQEDDEQCKELQNSWDKAAEERDRLREELKKNKDALMKEKEELEAKHRRLLKNEQRAKKNKEELQETIDKQNQIFNLSIDDFRKHFLIHVRDMNTWRPYLEEDRQYEWKPTTLPPADAPVPSTFNDKVLALLQICRGDNRNLQELLTLYEIETAEVVAVNIGKKQKRTKKYAWEQEFPEDLKAAMAKAKNSPRRGLEPPSAAAKAQRSPRSPRSGGTPRTPRDDAEGKEREGKSRKRADGKDKK